VFFQAKNKGNQMSHLDFTNEEILKFAESLGLGFYRVSHEGEFVECDDKARKIFSIPQGKDLSGFSIKSFYINPEERDVRIQRLISSELKYFCGTLSMRIDGKNKVLFDICKYDKSYRDKGTFVAFASEIENITLIPQMFDTFPMGIYEVDNEGKILRVNKKLVEILKYKDEKAILKKNIREFYEDKREMFEFTQEIKDNGFAQRILKFIDANKKIIEVECFSQYINEFKLARWAMLTDVTRRERYKRLFADVPTGVYYIENDRVKDCNYQFSRILGFDRSEGAIGIDTRDTFADPNDVGKFFSDLEAVDKMNEPLQNYPLKIRRNNDGKIITISIDTHIIKDGKGKEIGREGTIRDITERVELENRVNEAEKNLEKTTADINKFIHTFLHPVVKFAGNSELLNQVIGVLYQTIPLAAPLPSSSKELGEMLMTSLKEINTKISGMDDKPGDGNNDTHPQTGVKPSALDNFKENLTRIINIFDYSLKTEKSQKLLESTIRDTALWTLAELNRVNYSGNSQLKSLIKKDFIDFLQGILFNYLKYGTQILMGETEKMKKGVEALRSFIGMKKLRKYTFEKHHIGKLLEDNIQRFKPLLLEENIDVDFYYTGNLAAEISQNDIERVVCNLLQNVQKYSYKGESRFVKIRARELQPDDKVEFFVESFGIPIKKEEIDSGDIWKFGCRGEMAYASDRVGTGVGLADAKDVIDAHGGEIVLTSKPAAADGTPPGYKVPYITKITIRIPKSRQRKE
jgi:PAS domain S-box-containing protein